VRRDLRTADAPGADAGRALRRLSWKHAWNLPLE
jgi:hypothetical protein